MSSSLATASAAPTNVPSGNIVVSGSGVGGGSTGTTNTNATTASVAQFREIHKNTWLKRLTADGKKITVGPKKSDRTWVVFCVHDDTEALLEGYAEPRQAGSHSPEWLVRLQDTLHISHALIPNSHEFEFVVTLSNEVMRFHAMSWEIMQEWVETLRSKLREMKILSPRENLYTKLPEIRAPLAPTRDPTSPLPAPPPVPAALVPGTEIVTTAAAPSGTVAAAAQPQINHELSQTEQQQTGDNAIVNNSRVHPSETTPSTSSTSLVNATATEPGTSNNALSTTATGCSPPIFTAMSNTLTQNLLNMLSDPISAYSEQLHDEQHFKHDFDGADDDDDDDDDDDNDDDDANGIAGENDDDKSKENLEANISNEFVAKPSNHANLLRGGLENSVRLDVALEHRISADHLKNLTSLMQCERLIPRPHTSRSLSAGAADKSSKHKATPVASSRIKPSKPAKPQVSSTTLSSSPLASTTATTCASSSNSNNITELEVGPMAKNHLPTTSLTAPCHSHAIDEDAKTNITIIQVSESAEAETEASAAPKLPMKSITAEVFKFPDAEPPTTSTTSIKYTKPQTQHEYKSNVQIIPSNANSSTIQVLGGSRSSGMHVSTTVANQYSSPSKKQLTSKAVQKIVNDNGNANAATSVQFCPGDSNTSAISVYGTCYTPSGAVNGPASNEGTPKMPKKIILSANTSGVTNISVNNDTITSNSNQAAIRTVTTDNTSATVKHNAGNVHYEKVFLSSSIPITAAQEQSTSNTVTSMAATDEPTVAALNSSSTVVLPPKSPKWDCARRQSEQSTPKMKTKTPVATATPATSSQIQRVANQRMTSPSNNAVHNHHVATSQPPLPTRPPFLTRGLTEAVITTRPSRKDFHFLKLTTGKTKSQSGNNAKSHTQHGTGHNNNGETVGHPTIAQPKSQSSQQQQHVVHRTDSESLEHRRRSSSTSDARNTRSTNNNEHHTRNFGMSGVGGGGAGMPSAVLRIQQPPHVSTGTGGGTAANSASPSTKRMTLREQQVIQLRREIMHPGGVRLQLRRKDCIGSIAWVDAFGAVWVAGWKQKECPVLYNALHIGDQLLSIAGVTVSSAAEANKIIRNSNTLFVEMLVRRIPFGRGYAIRRDREGQCLGLIRDGNTSTIVDVVPNSLAARHGLPPKAQSCDGATLTFWVLTEINGRPLNLFFKENEIRDRLNSVGRDISILVQPADLIAKLKKQLKSLRGYKDYLVQ